MKDRIKRLEVMGKDCPECGFPGSMKDMKVVTHVRRAVPHWHDDYEPPPSEEPKFCPTCGVRLNPVIRWQRLPEVIERERGGFQGASHSDEAAL